MNTDQRAVVDRLIAVVEDKYPWIPAYKIALNWAELALNEGAGAIQVVDYIMDRVLQKEVRK